jgi:hypothetical protein
VPRRDPITHLGVEDERAVHKDGVVGSDGEIVHHHGVRNVYRHRLDSLASGVGDGIGAVRPVHDVVAEEVKLPCVRVHL